MAKLGGISGLSVAAIAAGGLLIYAGIVDAPVLDAVRDILQGRVPQGRTAKIGKAVGRASRAGASAAEGAAKGAKRAGKLTRLAGSIGDRFGAPRPGGRKHKGIDIPAAADTPIPAAAAGRVANKGYEPGGAGFFVTLDHGDLVTKYFHLIRSAPVEQGQQVSEGQTIGNVGSTGNSSGPHLHFEVWEGGQARDPELYI